MTKMQKHLAITLQRRHTTGKKDAECLIRVIPCIAHLMQDENVNVQKKVILCFAGLYRCALQWVSKAKTVSPEMSTIWDQVNHIKSTLAELIDSDNDGIRTHVVKFLEGLTLTLSKKTAMEFQASEVPKKQEKEISLDQVVENGRLIRLKKLEEEVNLPPTLAKSQVSSVRKNLKMQMLALLRHSMSADFVPQITTLLTDLGASQSEINKALPKDESRKRKLEEPGTSSKKAKIEPLPEVMLPDSMPAQFQSTYTPIAAAGTDSQIKHISRLLATQLTMAGMGKGVGELKLQLSGVPPRSSVESTEGSEAGASFIMHDSGDEDDVMEDHIFSDLRSRYDLAFSWLYQEYSNCQGFSSSASTTKTVDFASYDECLTRLLKTLSEMPDQKDGLFHRLILEAPIITTNAMQIIRKYCSNEEHTEAGMNTLRDLIVMRPKNRLDFLDLMLTFTASEKAEIRNPAILTTQKLYENPQLRHSIEVYAVKQLKQLLTEKPEADVKRFPGAPANIYTATSADIKRTILRVLEGPVKGMGMDSPELLTLVENCPKGSETLVMRVIHILTDKVTANASYVSPLTPDELLVALHNIDPNKCDMKTIIKAANLCFSERTIYTQEVLAIVMQRLMDQTPLPTLLMRTVIQSLSMYPRLIGFVLNILQRLIIKQLTNVFQVSPDLRMPLLQHVQSFTPHQARHLLKVRAHESRQDMAAQTVSIWFVSVIGKATKKSLRKLDANSESAEASGSGERSDEAVTPVTSKTDPKRKRGAKTKAAKKEETETVEAPEQTSPEAESDKTSVCADDKGSNTP
nr:hypothetical protein BaRGS_015012 [Batillaria attramentaria]